MSEVAEQSQVHAVEMALLPSISTSEKLLRQIAALLFILVMGLMTVLATLRARFASPSSWLHFSRSYSTPW
jgi:hypothetical protein